MATVGASGSHSKRSEMPGAEFNDLTHSLFSKSIASDADCPTIGITWCRAAAYCNWLNKQEGIPKEQWCYEPNERHTYADGMKIPADFLKRTGYRLPTELEWECALQANTDTTYPFSDSKELADRYAWSSANSQGHSWPVGLLKPNTFGMFDMLGNCEEWCHDALESQLKISRDAHGETVHSNEIRVIRGGSFDSTSLDSRTASVPDVANFSMGFRPARTCP